MLDSPHLFTHRYDIDTLLEALCTAPEGGLYLNTLDGTLHAAAPADGRVFTIHKLPASVLAEMAVHPQLERAEPETRAEVLRQLERVQDVAELPTLFDAGMAGGWLRERVKDYALEWLDVNDLIPPSMRHVPRVSKLAPAARRGKISIVEGM